MSDALFADYLKRINDALTAGDVLAVVAELERLPQSRERSVLMATSRRIAARVTAQN